jgi:hypothetical protein
MVLSLSYLRKRDYHVEISMTNTGGNDDITDVISDVNLHVVCGPLSTRLSPPEPLQKSETSFQGDYRLSVFGGFGSSNSRCPVVSHQIIES